MQKKENSAVLHKFFVRFSFLVVVVVYDHSFALIQKKDKINDVI